MNYIKIQNQLNQIAQECINHIIQLMKDHDDKIIHFENDNAYWINLDDRENAVKSVTCFLLYEDDLYFALNDMELNSCTLPISTLNSMPLKNFNMAVKETLLDGIYWAKNHADAVETVDMLHMVECYYNVD